MNATSRASQPGSTSNRNGPATPAPARQRLDGGSPDRLDRRPRRELDAVVIPLIGLLTRASRRILHDDALADDAIQETLLAYWTRAEQPENPRAWLLHAVTLRSLHLARSYRRRREHERRACLGRPEGSHLDDPACSLDHADLVRVLDESLGRLADDFRAVFMLWTFEELDYAGIAAALQIPIGTVRSRLNRTRKAIRESLARVAVGDPWSPVVPRDRPFPPTGAQAEESGRRPATEEPAWDCMSGAGR